jgi:hypothetical protein
LYLGPAPFARQRQWVEPGVSISDYEKLGAFGLGVVLATQNPVDLDYKGLSNAGTWFI